MSDQHTQSVKLFFRTFENHLSRIRDDGKDANQAYRAQVLLSQIALFEKAILEDGGGGGATGDIQSFVELIDIEAFGDLAAWAVDQTAVTGIRAVHFLDQSGEWHCLAGEGILPMRLRAGEWLRSGLVAQLQQAKNMFITYLFGQPRLVLQFEEGETAVDRGKMALFFARLLPIFVTDRIGETNTYAADRAVIAKDPHFCDLLGLIEKAANKDVSILLEGESGTGKEVIANFIHRHSPRAGKPIVAVNCAAIPAGLIESELFGHEKGAFTNAYNRQIGRVEEADGGTLFLDEIGEMPFAMQAKLLRFLQLHEFHRVGGKNKISVDVRIVAATNRHLKDQVAKGEFREDLYYRLSVMPFVIPPLRERIDDIAALSEFFFDKYGRAFGFAPLKIDPAIYQHLVAYAFPGNVRELENLIQNILVIAQGGNLSVAHLPPNIRELTPVNLPERAVGSPKRVWRPRSSYGRNFKWRRGRSTAAAAAGNPELERLLSQTPKNNDELKLLKQEIQNYASDLTLLVEHRFLKDLLDRAEGSMPKASTLGNINRTLLYKMIDRTKHLDD
ncbi:Sigma-54-dependent Fis family transcriptional regulator [Acanthopleuribacter pedis]